MTAHSPSRPAESARRGPGGDRRGRDPAATDNDGIHQAAGFATRRGMVVVLGDLFGDLDTIVGGLDHLRYRNHEVIVFHLMDPGRDLSVDGHIRFRDLESGETLTTQAEAVREAYQEAVDDVAAEVEVECRKRAIDRIELTTHDPPDRARITWSSGQGHFESRTGWSVTGDWMGMTG